jgi:hypothetical protein
MCGRYRRTTQEEELARRYGIEIPRQMDLPISWDVASSQDGFGNIWTPESNKRFNV